MFNYRMVEPTTPLNSDLFEGEPSSLGGSQQLPLAVCCCSLLLSEDSEHPEVATARKSIFISREKQDADTGGVENHDDLAGVSVRMEKCCLPGICLAE